MKVHNLPKVVTKNDFPRLGVEPGSLDPKANTLPTEPSCPAMATLHVRKSEELVSIIKQVLGNKGLTVGPLIEIEDSKLNNNIQN
jgi:hypothetical protein